MDKILVSFVLRRTYLILLVSLVLSLIGGYFTAKLYQNLKTDLEELLPTSSRSVRDLDEVARRLKSIDSLAVLVFSKDTIASKRFVTDLATQLETLPKSEVAGVEYRIDHELNFFRQRQALYVDVKDLDRVRDYVRERLNYETEIRNPLNIFSGAEIPEPELDFRSLRKKYGSRERDYARLPGGFFATPDETKRVILVDVPGKTLGIGGIKRLKDQIVGIISRLGPRSYASDLEIHYSGSVEEMLEEQQALVEDLAASTVAVIVLVSLAMFVFFQSFRATLALVLSLFAGTLWTFGVSYFAVGYLNANSAFLGSIVIGNGINFGIILLARYLEQRRQGESHDASAGVAIRFTWKATLTAALAAGLSYGSLMLTSFRGFKQFGVIGLVGMALCWLSAYTLLPALLSVVDKLGRNRAGRPIRAERRAVLTGGIAKLISRCPGITALVSAVLTLTSIATLTRAGPGLLETNLEKLRSKQSIESGAAHYTRYLNEIFQRFLTPVAILASSHQDALAISAKLKGLQRQQGEKSNIVSVQTIDDFIPRNQAEKIAVLRKISSLLPTKIMARLDEKDRRLVKTFLTSEVFRPFDLVDLPGLVREKFTEKDGSIGRLVLVEPPLSHEIWEEKNLTRFVSELRSVADSVDPGAPVAGGMAITSDLVQSISRDGPRATLMAFLAVVILVVLLFHEVKTVVLSLVALLVGVGWFGAIVVLLGDHGLKINFLNFVALPITFGIGVDYGVNVFQRYRQQKGRDIACVIRETGGAVGLCSLTTIIGYSSLLMASNQGFVSFGVLAVLGEVSCITAALVALPAILTAWGRRGSFPVANFTSRLGFGYTNAERSKHANAERSRHANTERSTQPSDTKTDVGKRNARIE